MKIDTPHLNVLAFRIKLSLNMQWKLAKLTTTTTTVAKESGNNVSVICITDMIFITFKFKKIFTTIFNFFRKILNYISLSIFYYLCIFINEPNRKRLI